MQCSVFVLIKLNFQKICIVAFTFLSSSQSYFSRIKKKCPFSLYLLYHRDLFMNVSKQDHILSLSDKRIGRTESGKRISEK